MFYIQCTTALHPAFTKKVFHTMPEAKQHLMDAAYNAFDSVRHASQKQEITREGSLTVFIGRPDLKTIPQVCAVIRKVPKGVKVVKELKVKREKRTDNKPKRTAKPIATPPPVRSMAKTAIQQRIMAAISNGMKIV